MPKIPDPAALMESARSAKRFIDDREWKQYQRYLEKHKRLNGSATNEEPLDFERFCEQLRKTK